MGSVVEKWTEGRLYELVYQWCNPPGKPAAFAVAPQVESASDGKRNKTVRYADAIACSLWRSRGFWLQGFEIKVSKSDWKRELKDPAKAEEIARFCRHWWVVAPPGIVDVDELPLSWGLLEPVGSRAKDIEWRLNVVKKAGANDDPVPVGIEFMSKILRRIGNIPVASDEITKAKDAGLQEGFSKGKATAGYEITSLRAELDDSREKLNNAMAFEGASGLHVLSVPWHEWRTSSILDDPDIERIRRLGALVRLIRMSKPRALGAMIENTTKELKSVTDKLQAGLDALKGLDESLPIMDDSVIPTPQE